jgi:2-iminobutanoate/2-iminopropanoate deaminase
MSDPNKPKKYGPYSVVRTAGPFVFVSGQVGIDPTTGVAPEGVTGQTEQAMRNVAAALGTVGLGLGNVVDTTVFLTDVEGDFADFNTAYAGALQAAYRDTDPGIPDEAMAARYPARACIGVAGLPPVGNVPLVVEVKATAMRTDP